MAKVNLSIKGKKYRTVTLAWMQGERDAREKQGKEYVASLKCLINQLSQDLRRTNIHFVIGRLNDFDLNNEKYPHWTRVRKSQVKVAEASPWGAWVNTDDLNDGLNSEGVEINNDLHYSVEGYKLLGQRFAEKAIEWVNDRFNKPDAAAGVSTFS